MTLNITLRTVIENDKKNSTEDDDYVTKSMGAFGLWQFIFCTICSLARIIATWNVMSILFLTPNTDFLCVAFENDTREAENSTCYTDCKEYTYHDEIFDRSVISEFGLVCDKAWLASLVQSGLMFGLLIGVSCFGWLSDRFGRRKALILSAFSNVAFMLAVPFSPDFWTLICLRFFTGFTCGGLMTITFVVTLEMVGQNYREVAGNVVLIGDGPTEATLSLFAYLTHTWNDYMLSYAGVAVVFFFILLSIPETPRWLVAKGKVEEAVELMTRAAKFNGRPTSSIKDHVEKAYQELKEKTTRDLSFADLFRTRELTLTTIASMVLWFVAGVSYYGITQYISIMGTHVYVVVAVLGVSQVPSYVITLAITKFFKRRPSTIGTELAVSFTMMLLIFIPENTWASTTIGIIGATAANANFALAYLYVTELYPTPLRNIGFGVSSSASKFGAMLAPFIANIQPRWIASMVFALLPIVASVFCLLIPETKGRKLKDSLE